MCFNSPSPRICTAIGIQCIFTFTQLANMRLDRQRQASKLLKHKLSGVVLPPEEQMARSRALLWHPPRFCSAGWTAGSGQLSGGRASRSSRPPEGTREERMYELVGSLRHNRLQCSHAFSLSFFFLPRSSSPCSELPSVCLFAASCAAPAQQTAVHTPAQPVAQPVAQPAPLFFSNRGHCQFIFSVDSKNRFEQCPERSSYISQRCRVSNRIVASAIF